MMRLYQAPVLALLMAGCGGGSMPTVVPTPTPTPIVQVTPTPSPSPSECPDGSCGNTKTVVRATLRLYLLMDEQGRLVNPTPDPVRQVVQEPIPVGYTIRLDVSGKDANGDETDGHGNIQWFYSGQDLVDTNIRTPWMRDIKVVKPGPWSVYVVFDGVGSNDLNFTFVPFQ